MVKDDFIDLGLDGVLVGSRNKTGEREAHHHEKDGREQMDDGLHLVFDAMGRRVLNLRPGVLFVRESVGGERPAAGVRKVVVTR